MIKLLWSGFFIMVVLSGCGYNGTPTRGPQGIIPLTSLEIVPDSSKIAVGTSTKLTAYGYYAGVRSDITDLVDWSIDPATPTVAEFKYTTAPNKNRVSGIASGTANITATFDGVTSAPISLTVSSATVSSIAVTPVAPSVIKDDSQQFIAKGTFPSDPGMDNGWIQDLTFDAAWKSSDKLVSTVVSGSESNNGLATGVSKGTATITATLGVIFGDATLSVIELQSIAVTPTDSSIAGFAKTVQFIAIGTYSDGSTNSTKDISSTVTWDSSQKSFATIASGGLATTVAAGTTSISATLNGSTGSTNLTVTAPVPSSLQISPANPTLSISTGITTLQLTATAFYADNSSQIVTSNSIWEISPPSSIATVTAGLVTWTTGTTTGIVTVKATYLGQSITTNVNITQ